MNLIANLRSTYMTYPGFQFSKHLHFYNEVVAIVKLVLHMAQVAGTHMDTQKSLQTIFQFSSWIPTKNILTKKHNLDVQIFLSG